MEKKVVVSGDWQPKVIETDFDLKSIRFRSWYLQGVAKEYRLAEHEYVLFSNKARTRFRAVMRLFGVLHLIVPEIDEENENVVFVRVCRAFEDQIVPGTAPQKVLESLRITGERRVERRKRR